jgi:DNA polymerase III alpha subunit
MLREQDGLFTSLDNFTERTGASLEQLLILIRINAFRFAAIPKAQLMWMAHLLTGKKPDTSPGLFSIPVSKFKLPEPEADPVQDAYDEMELLGYCVSMSPFDLLQTAFRGQIMAREMLHYTGKTVRMLGWLVAIKYVRTIKKETMHFGCFIDHQGDFFDTVHFPQTSRAFPFRGNGVYLLKGIINEEFGFPSLTVDKMARLPLRPDPRS